jgi:hypothetical protein
VGAPSSVIAALKHPSPEHAQQLRRGFHTELFENARLLVGHGLVRGCRVALDVAAQQAV